MRQSAIILARTVGFIELADLLSGGKTSTLELVRQTAERYSFRKFPKTLEDLDSSKGIEFLEGQAEECPITKLLIWQTGITVETRIGTNASKKILEDLLSWAVREVGINQVPIKRFAYISDVSFFSDAPLLEVHPAVVALAARTTEEVSRIWQEPVKYEPLGVRVGHDPLARKNSVASFSIDRRAEARFSENKYFSEAPLPTHIHWEMLEQYEENILLSLKKPARV